MKPVSVIMIAYNAEKTLDRAMKSVMNQTMQNIEIICVDDCSTDNTFNMLQGYAKRDSRITVLRHEKNKGLIGARHTGIMHASGQYTLLMDSDDELIENACEYLYTEITRQHVDVLQFGVIIKPEAGCAFEQKVLDDMKWFTRLPNAELVNGAHEVGDLIQACFVDKLIAHNV